MKHSILKSALLAIALYVLQSFSSAPQWFKAGSKPQSYIMGIDDNMERNKKNVNNIKSKEEAIDGFGTYMTNMKPADYAGKRLRMTGYMKSSNVYDWAGFWMRVDGDDTKGQPLAFDNMNSRAVKGNNDWTKCEIVLDISPEASNIAYGALLSGAGQIWFDDVTFEVVDKSVQTTNMH